MEEVIHNNGISHVKTTREKRTFITSGRDSKILLFDIRRLNIGESKRFSGFSDGNFSPIFEFKDHESENYNITPCLLENQKYIVTGSLDNLLYFYDLETGLLSHHVETDSSFIAGVYDFSPITHQNFNIGYITTLDSSINFLAPKNDFHKDHNKVKDFSLDPQDILKIKITTLMSKHSELFLDMIINEDYNLAQGG